MARNKKRNWLTVYCCANGSGGFWSVDGLGQLSVGCQATLGDRLQTFLDFELERCAVEVQFNLTQLLPVFSKNEQRVLLKLVGDLMICRAGKPRPQFCKSQFFIFFKKQGVDSLTG